MGGSIYSMVEPFATAMLVADGAVAWLGGDGAARTQVDSVDEVVDLGGALITPAFVDAHVHTTASGMAGVGVDLSGAGSVADVLDAVRAEVERGGGAGPVLGFGWDEREWPDPRPPSRTELDRAAYGGAVFLDRADVHSSAVSSALLTALPELASLQGFSATGLLTDIAHHTARAAVFDGLPDDVRRDAQRRIRAQAAAVGIGAFHEMGGPRLAGSRDLVALLDLAESEPGPAVVGYWAEEGGFTRLPDPRVRGCAGDLFADGTIGSHTAGLRTRFADADTTGHEYLTAARVRDHVVGCTEAGLQAGFHVIGDGALDTVLAGFGEAAERIGVDRIRAGQHRLEHVELVHPEHITALAQLGIVASVQPLFDALWGAPGGLYDRRLGSDRWELMNPFAAMQSAGVALALGSDSPVTPIGPWAAVRAAAFHHRPEARVSVRAAFAAHTRGGWRAAGAGHLGVLAPGMPASFAVWGVADLVVQAPDTRVAGWSTDPRSGTPGLPDLSPGVPLPECLRTVVDGTVVFDAGRLS